MIRLSRLLGGFALALTVSQGAVNGLATEGDLLASWDFEREASSTNPQGRLGRALALDGSSWVEADGPGLLDRFTIAVWIRPDSCAPDWTSLISESRWGPSSLHLLVDRDARLQLSVGGNDPVDVASESTVPAPASDWVHAAVTYDSSRKRVAFYLNGKLDREVVYATANPARLTRFQVGSWNGASRFYQGQLDDLRVYDRVLEVQDIRALAEGREPVPTSALHWSFDERSAATAADHSGHGHEGKIVTHDSRAFTLESVRMLGDRLQGRASYAAGVSGRGLKLDGFTAWVERSAGDAPDVSEGFTVEAWVAPQTYPWNWTAIVNQERGHEAGYFFGLDAWGHPGLHATIEGAWRECRSSRPVPLLEWSHVAGVYDPSRGLSVYVNGEPAGELLLEGPLTPASETPLWIGRSHTRLCPSQTERGPSAAFLSDMLLDGLLDEVRVHGRPLDPASVLRAADRVTPATRRPLRHRRLPSGPEGPRRFGAYYTRLEYCDEWDAQWPVGPYADVLVRFDDTPTRIVFWRGMNYAPSYVTENGIWIGDQSLERMGPQGCYEHMSDKQCRYASVRVLESHDARVVVHWRYAVCGIDYSLTDQGLDLGWGPWADEYFLIYPDGVVVRHQVLWPDSQKRNYWWQETIFFNQPGTRPEDNVELEAVTLANLLGESASYSWETAPPGGFPMPSDARILVTNLKARYRHFLIHEPGGSFGIFWGHNALSHFTCWNHWPVAQLPNDGRQVTAFDRPSHTSLTIPYPAVRDGERGSREVVSLYGLTERSAAELVPLARSWSHPCNVQGLQQGYTDLGYDRFQRAYRFAGHGGEASGSLAFTLPATEASPLVNPTFVVEGWSDETVRLRVDGKEIPRGGDFRYAVRHRLEGPELVAWVRLESSSARRIELVSLASAKGS